MSDLIKSIALANMSARDDKQFVSKTGDQFVGAAPTREEQLAKLPERGVMGAINDNIIEIANAALGGVSAAANMVSPGNRASQFIEEEFIKPGEDAQSERTKAEKRMLREDLENAEGAGDEVGAFLRYVARNPGLAISQAAGSFAIPGGVAKGAAAGAKALGMGAKGASRVGLGAVSATSGAMAGGDAAGSAYDLVKRTPEEILAQNSEYQELLKTMDADAAREEVATRAARKASVVPAVIGATLGPLGAERILAGAGKAMTASRAKNALITGGTEAATEGFEEGATTYSANKAASEYNPTIDPAKGVAGATTMGAVLGAGPGVVTGAIEAPAQPKPKAPPLTEQTAAQPNSPLSKAAVAGVAAAPAPAPVAQEPDPVSMLNERATTLDQEVRDSGALMVLRQEDSPFDPKQFISDLAIARSPSTANHMREQAMARLEVALDWVRNNTPQSQTADLGMPDLGAIDAALGDRELRLSMSEPDRQQLTMLAAQAKDTRIAPAARADFARQAFEIIGRYSAPASDPIVAPAPAQGPAPALLQNAPAPAPVAPSVGTTPEGRAASDVAAARLQELEAQDGQAGQAAPGVMPARSVAAADPRAAAETRLGQLEQEESLPPIEAFSAPVEQQTVAGPTEAEPEAPAAEAPPAEPAFERISAPNVVAPPAAPGDNAPAFRRKRVATLDQLASIGFDRIERREDGFYFLNPQKRQEFKLEGAADAAMAKAAADRKRNADAQAAATSVLNDKPQPTEGKARAGQYEKGDITFDGLKIAVENPVGSTRSGTAPDGTKWSVDMKSHYGFVRRTEGADGDQVDVYVPENARVGAPVFVFDQYKDDGSFDEHKVVLGVTSQEAAERIYDQHFSDGSGPRRRKAVKAMSMDEFKTWLKSDRTKSQAGVEDVALTVDPKTAPGTEIVKVDGAPVTVADESAFPEAPTAAANGRRATTKSQARLVRGIASLFGKKVVFFSGTTNDGFVIPSAPDTIYLNESSSVTPLAVFGHELMHLLKAENPIAYKAIAEVVRKRVTNAKGFREDYYGQFVLVDGQGKQVAAFKSAAEARKALEKVPGGRLLEQTDAALNDAELEELISDLNGDAMRNGNFWADVFAQVQKDAGPQATTVIAKLVATVQEMLNRLSDIFQGQRGFESKRFVSNDIRDLDAIRGALRDGMARYMKDAGASRTKLQAEVQRAKTEIKKSAARPAAEASPSPEFGIHFSREPRTMLNGAFYGQGLKGLEAERLRKSGDSRLKSRVYFYIDEGKGVRPEAGVGGVAHRVKLPKLYDAKANPDKLWNSGDLNATESAILDAGYDGYWVKNHETGQGIGVVIGKASTSMKAETIATPGVPAAPQAAPQPVRRGLMSAELNQVDVTNIPGARLSAGTLIVPQESREAANAEMERIGSPIRFSPERDAVDVAQREYAEVEARYRDTDQWMRAPNGQPTLLNERQWVQVRTPSFKSWFGDWEEALRQGGVWAADIDVSKVVDENGEPMVVYHGTETGGFAEFKRPSGERRGDMGVFTTADYGMARSYARRGRAKDFTAEDLENYEEGGRNVGVYALFVNMRNPHEENFEGANWDGQRYEQFQVRDANDEPVYNDEGRAYFDQETAERLAAENDGAEVMPADPFFTTTDGAVREARRYDSDGAIIREVMDDGGGPGYSGDPADIFVAFDPNQLKSADFNAGTFSVSSDDIRLSTGRDKKASRKPKQDAAIGDRTDVSKLPNGRAVPDSVAVGSLESSLEMARGKSYRKGRDLKVDLQERVLNAAKQARVDISKRTKETFKFLSNMVFNDAKFALQSNENAIGWYDSKISRAIGAIALVHPEINTDPLSRLAFLWALAVTSNGVKVNMNFALAERAYSAWKASDADPQKRRMPNNIGIGNAASAIKDGLDMFNELGAKFGSERLIKFMVTEFTVGEIERMLGTSVGGEWKSTPVRGAAILGPKIGNGFYSNLNGFFDALTMDRWLMRTFGRMTGTLLGVTKEDVKASREKLGSAIAALSATERQTLGQTIGARIGKKLTRSDIDRIATLSQKASMKKEKREVMMSSPAMDKFRKDANNHAMTMDGQKEAPAGPAERNWIRAIFTEALEKLHADGKKMTMSDLQALLWYPERRLYDAAKSDEDVANGYEDDEAPDYANAAMDMAVRAGFSREDVLKAMDDAEARGTVKGAPLTAAEKAAMLEEFRAPPKQQFQFAFEVAPDPDDKDLTAAWERLPIKERARITKQVKDAVVEEIARIAGVPLTKVAAAMGSFMGAINPNLLAEFKKSKVTIEQARGLAAAIGFVLDQNSVALVDERASGTAGMIRVNFSGAVAKHLSKVYDAILAEVPGVDFTARGSNFDILNFTGMSNEELAGKIGDALEGVDVPLESTVTFGDINSELVEKADYESHLEGLRPESGQDVRAGLRELRDRARSIVAAEVNKSGGARAGQPAGAAGRADVQPAAEAQAGQVDPSAGDEALKFSPRRDAPPTKTVKAYKLFRVDPKRPGQLFPLFVDANTPVPIGAWLDADVGEQTSNGKVKSKLGPLAFRPGWHAGDLPIATHIGAKSDAQASAPDTRPDNQVWAEVEMSADVNWQPEADRRGTNAQGRIVAGKAHITDRIPTDGFYRYKTNPNMTGNWLIGGSIKVTRVLSDEEVAAINEAAGVQDLPRSEPFDAAKYGLQSYIKNELDEVPVDKAAGREVTYEVEIEDGGETARVTVDAGAALTDYDERISTIQGLLECLRK